MNVPPVRYARTSDGYDIAYMASGEGRPLVLMPAVQNHIVHYWHSNAMRPGFEALAARFRLIQYDCRGQGMSSRGLRPDMAPEDWCRDLDAVVTQEGLDHFVLVDQHGRGHVSSLYALAHPERIDALVLINIALSRTTMPVAMDSIVREDWDFYVQAVGPLVLPWEEPARARAIIRDIWTRTDVEMMRRSTRLVLTEDAWPRLGLPVLVLAPRDGVYMFVTGDDSRRLTDLIPGARLIVLDEPGCGLYGYSGEPPGAQIIEDFLESLDAALPESAGLSHREAEVLRLLAAGRSNPQIAEALVLSPSTVAKHVSSILAKTESANRTEAAVYAKDHGLA